MEILGEYTIRIKENLGDTSGKFWKNLENVVSVNFVKILEKFWEFYEK